MIIKNPQKKNSKTNWAPFITSHSTQKGQYFQKWYIKYKNGKISLKLQTIIRQKRVKNLVKLVISIIYRACKQMGGLYSATLPYAIYIGPAPKRN